MKLFDSLSHPTMNGLWVNRGLDSSFSILEKSLIENNFIGACAVGLPNDPSYAHDIFFNACLKYPSLYPVAAIQDLNNLEREFNEIANIGYKAIKIHPRFLKVTSDIGALKDCFALANHNKFVIFYCTYCHCEIDNYPLVDPLYELIKLLQYSQNTKVILVHGGDTRILEYMEIVRHSPNLLLDLSLTLLKYSGSSIDSDLKFLFSNFDQRICIGSDHPEYSHSEVLNKFKTLSEGVSLEKRENIGYKNIMKFLEILS